MSCVALLVLGLIYLASVVQCESNLQSSPNCRDRELTINADSQFHLYVDGREVVGLRNADDSKRSDVVQIIGNTRLLAVQVHISEILGGVLASLDRDDILSDDSWKCTNDFYPNWMALSFNDDTWPYAQVLCRHGYGHWGYIDGISYKASWITAPDSLVCHDGNVPSVAYCRKTLDHSVVCRSHCNNGTSGSRCIRSCANLPDGEYQSCNGCHIYISCSEQKDTERRCKPKRRVWDDYAKRCMKISTTCQCPYEDEFTDDV